MPSNGSIFFAGVGTTFLILGVGFGSGLMMANSALKDVGRTESRASAEAPSPLRVVLPSSAEAAEPKAPPQQQAASGPAAATPAPIRTERETQASPDKRQASADKVEKADTGKAEADQRDRRKRAAERKARRLAAARRNSLPQVEQRAEAPVMAFGGDESRQGGAVSLFGN
ncbi:hypothetical protein [Bradyrhizobium sp. 199]|uniref:hypothetical protein n=1 Tax=Bradyrhizobium sp. 199 TaxID=2782664 RepID=UPI001FFBFC55|nr:hypothetical protein [Bradyrhizobium sp. 199]MCK1362303.1 hypothetical protein [Bradyrhizobium sp. 199]